MIDIRATMNSPVEEILAFKTCCGVRAFDQNLEILLKNRGSRPVVVPSYFDLHGARGTCRINTLMPNGYLQVLPREVKAFYCMMDEVLWNAAREMVFYDTEGNTYPVAVQKQIPG